MYFILCMYILLPCLMLLVVKCFIIEKRGIHCATNGVVSRGHMHTQSAHEWQKKYAYFRWSFARKCERMHKQPGHFLFLTFLRNFYQISSFLSCFFYQDAFLVITTVQTLSDVLCIEKECKRCCILIIRSFILEIWKQNFCCPAFCCYASQHTLSCSDWLKSVAI